MLNQETRNMHNFKHLDIWVKSKDLVKDIYQITCSFPNSEMFGLTSQIQRAAVSIPSNIAEGSAKSSNKDFSRFLEISIGSSFELETLFILAFDLGYIDKSWFECFGLKINEIQKMLIGFKHKLKPSWFYLS